MFLNSAIDEDEEENSEVNFSLGEVRMFNVDGSSPLVSAGDYLSHCFPHVRGVREGGSGESSR